LKFLYSLQSFGIKLGLRNIEILLKFAGNPETKFPSVHIAGTNGKGSTSAMIASVLTASGYRVGLYTSPHLVSFNERIRVNGRMISDDDLSKYTNYFKSQITKTKATFFEATTAIAFQYFADQQVDIAIIETGLGGRYDATNVVHPLLSIITTINYDHTEHLGNTLKSIAFEKGGIIKQNTPCITGVTQQEPLSVLKDITREKSAPLIQSQKASSISAFEYDISGLTLSIKTKNFVYQNLKISLAGEHQSLNARTALVAIEQLQQRCGFSKISEATVRAGLGDVQSYSGFHGRLEIVQTDPLLIVDVGHNPDGIQTTITSLRKTLVNKPVVVFGVMKDKDYRLMISYLCKFARVVIAVKPNTERALASTVIVKEFHSHQFPALDGVSVSNGIELAKNIVRKDEAIIVLGSFYVAAEVMERM